MLQHGAPMALAEIDRSANLACHRLAGHAIYMLCSASQRLSCSSRTHRYANLLNNAVYRLRDKLHAGHASTCKAAGSLLSLANGTPAGKRWPFTCNLHGNCSQRLVGDEAITHAALQCARRNESMTV